MAIARGPWRTASASGRVLLARVWQRYREHRIADQSAKLSFYFLLSVFPLLALLTSIAGLVLQGASARELLYSMLASVAPASAWKLIQDTVREIVESAGGIKLSFAIAGTVWAASRGTAATIEGLNVAYEVRQYRTWWRRNLLAVGLTLAVSACALLSLVLVMLGGHVVERIGAALGIAGWLAAVWSAAQYAFALGLLLLGFNALYIVGPNVLHHRWYWLMPGTVVGVILWLLASWGFKTYLRYFDHYSATYGSIGAVIVLMMWFYLSGIAILLGAEFNSEIEKAMSGGSAGAAKE